MIQQRMVLFVSWDVVIDIIPHASPDGLPNKQGIPTEPDVLCVAFQMGEPDQTQDQPGTYMQLMDGCRISDHSLTDMVKSNLVLEILVMRPWLETDQDEMLETDPKEPTRTKPNHSLLCNLQVVEVHREVVLLVVEVHLVVVALLEVVLLVVVEVPLVGEALLVEVPLVVEALLAEVPLVEALQVETLLVEALPVLPDLLDPLEVEDLMVLMSSWTPNKFKLFLM